MYRSLFLVLTALALAAIPACAQQVPAPAPSPLPGLAYDAEFFPGAHYDANVPTPASVLGFRVGDKAASHGQIEAVIKAIAAKSPRCRLFEYGKTHEGRTLYYLVIASEANLAKLDDIKAGSAKLADPRSAGAGEVDGLVDSAPAIAWMAYCIHGDEMSGSDAALAAIHHLAACTDDDVKQLLANVVVIFDPLMNPDGRDRWITQIAQNRTVQPSVDDQSLLHSGTWPYGRMNHYLFDMNRDWIFCTQPETRGRVRAVNEWHPHYFLESHEMGSQDTFLFMPPREPINPNYPRNVFKWVNLFAQDQGKAFDARGWRYYTGEWNEEWYPGYSSSWAAMRGAIENLYEQADISTDGVRRPEGTIEAYREAVHHQLVSTMANLTTLAKNRKQVLADYVAEKRRVVADDSPYAGKTFAVVPGANAARVGAFLDLMAIQGIEVFTAGKAFRASGKDRLGREVSEREFPEGTVLVPNKQPLANLIGALLEFDPRMSAEFLTDERRELLRFNRSKLYDITGWSIPMMFDVECIELATGLPVGADAKRWTPAPAPAAGPVTNADTGVAFVIDGVDDGSVVAAVSLMEREVWVRVADKVFEFDGHAYARGSLVITRKDNPRKATDAGDALVDAVRAACARAGVTATGIRSGMGPGDLPDLGGEHFVLLQPPRVAVLGRAPFGPYSYGQAWYEIDHTLGMRASYLDADAFGGIDLRRYNVVVLPSGSGSWITEKVAALKAWVEAGGTLIAIGSSAAALANEKGIGTARQLGDVLSKPEVYVQAVIREWEGVSAAPDVARVWSQVPPSGEAAVQYPWDGAGGEEKIADEELKRRDEWRRIFAPQGVLVAGRVDDRSWLTAGCGAYVPVMVSGDTVLVSPAGVQAPVRLGVFSPAPPQPPPAAPPKPEPAKDDEKKDGDKKTEPKKPKPGWMIAPPGFELRLRMSGLLWPEAAERIANSAFVTRQSVGAGQVILFADEPNFRAASLGTVRIFSNAVVYGPGMGASQPIRP